MKQPAPLVSICIPCFNQGEYLAAAIDSAFGQSHPNLEVIVSNNGSGDCTAEVMAGYEGRDRFRALHQASTLAMTEHWNVFRDVARGEWLILLCADDILHMHCVSRCLELAQTPESIVAVFFEMDWLRDSGVEIKTPFYQSSALLPAHKQFEIFLRGNNFPLSACMINAAAIRKVGWFNKEFKYASDWQMWLSLCWKQAASAKQTWVGYVAESLGLYRHHGENETYAGIVSRTALPEIAMMKEYFIQQIADPKRQNKLREIADQGTAKLARQYATTASQLGDEDLQVHYLGLADDYASKVMALENSKPNTSPLCAPYPLLEGSLDCQGFAASVGA